MNLTHDETKLLELLDKSTTVATTEQLDSALKQLRSKGLAFRVGLNGSFAISPKGRLALNVQHSKNSPKP